MRDVCCVMLVDRRMTEDEMSEISIQYGSETWFIGQSEIIVL